MEVCKSNLGTDSVGSNLDDRLSYLEVHNPVQCRALKDSIKHLKYGLRDTDTSVLLPPLPTNLFIGFRSQHVRQKQSESEVKGTSPPSSPRSVT